MPTITNIKTLIMNVLTKTQYNSIQKSENEQYYITDDDYFALKTDIKTKTSQLTNDSGFITTSYHDSTKQDTISDLATIRSGAEAGATAIQSVKTINNNSIVGTGNLDIDSLPSQEGQNGKYLKTDGTNASWEVASSYHPPLLSCQWSDHIINDIQWLRADTFSWQSGDVYTSVYNKLVEENNQGTWTTDSKTGFMLSPNGFKIVNANREQDVIDAYNSTGIAWYYILDTVNKRFKLPRTKWGFEGLRTNVGDDIAESLPNIAGNFRSAEGGWSPNGAFAKSSTHSEAAYGSSANMDWISFSASRYSSTYKDNAPVQERATQMYLYFYVGEFAQTSIEQTAGITTEQFNGKVDLSASNLNTNGKSFISGLGMPSSRYVDLTLGASGSTYTAPANGYFVINKTTSGTNQYVNIRNNTNGLIWENKPYSNGSYASCFLQVKRGDVVIVYYTAAGTTNVFRFIYAEGEQ